MNKDEAKALATELANEAAAEGLLRDYVPIPSANHDEWAVKETDGFRTLQLWVSEDISFPL